MQVPGKKHLKLIVVLSVATGCISCFGPLRIEVTEKNPPSFILHDGSSGYLGAVLVKEFTPDGTGENIWIVGPPGGSTPMSYLHATEIRYGEVPNGWVQQIPKQSVKAPALIEGKTYQVICRMFDTESRAAIFSLNDGKVVQKVER